MLATSLNLNSIDEFRTRARRALPRMVFDFVDGGSGMESTLRENRMALDRVRLVGSALIDVSHRSQAVSIFGQKLAMPIIIGPTGLAGTVWPKADVHLARAAARYGIPFVMSTAATATMEEVAAAGDGNKWFQLYLFRDRKVNQRLISRAADLGFSALEVTVDGAIPGRRLRDNRNGFSLPLKWTPQKIGSVLAHPAWAVRMMLSGAPKLSVMAAELGLTRTDTIAEMMQAQLDPTITWADIGWVRDQWKGPLIVKGLSNPAQAKEAVALGVDGIVVSNHGGRQLDGAVASIDILPEFVSEVGSKLTVLVDSGFQSGTDVAKALALGAIGVQLGRATLYAAAVGGESAINTALDVFHAELDVAQCLMGVLSFGEMRPSMIRRYRA